MKEDDYSRMILPSERKKHEANQKLEHDKQQEKFRHAFNGVFNTADGLIVLKWLCDQCGYQKASIMFNREGEVNPQSLVYNEARRNIYLQIREMILPETLAKIENKPKDKI